MKIAQFFENQQIRLGLIKDGSIVPLDFEGTMTDFIKVKGSCEPSGSPIPLERVRLAPPVSNPSKIIAIGLNYMDHVQESKGEIPKSPLVFSKFPSSLIGPDERITWDRTVTVKVDFEAELAVIMGKDACCCSENQVYEAIFGYTCANDVSARDLQFGDGQWVRGKSLDTFCPLGPWIVTTDEIPDPHSLHIRSLVNGAVMQDSNTSRLIFKLPELISFLSRHFTLLPGDLILTGTPHGVGAFRDPSVYLQDGDEVVVEIDAIGRLANTCQVL